MRYSADLPTSAVTVTDTTASLQASMGGVPLRISWTLDRYSYVIAFGDASSAAGGYGGWTAGGQGAHSEIRFGGATCRSEDGLIGTAVGHDSAAYGAALGTAFRGTSLQGARCVAPPEAAPIP